MKNRYLILLPEYTLGGLEAQMRQIIYSLEEKHILADVCILNTLKKGKNSLLDCDRKRLRFVDFFELHMYHRSEYQERESIREYVIKNMERMYRVVLIFNQTYTPLIPFFRENGISTVYSERSDGNRTCNDEICRLSVKECDILCANSFCAARKMELEFARKIRVIPNGKEYRERLGYTRKKQIKNILVPCRIAPIKNLGIVVDMAFAHADRSFVVHFVGGKDYVNYAKSLEDKVKNYGIGDKVFFTGYKEFMEEEYFWADLVILPSFIEGASNVVLEAYQYGRPIIVSDIESERELVTDDRLRFSTESAEELFKCIEYVEKLSDAKFDWEVDVIVVTAISYFNAVKDELKRKWDGDIISLEDVIYEEQAR